MKLPSEVFGDVVVVHAPQELGEDQTEAFEAYLRTLDQDRIVLDLDGTEVLDSVGLTSLLNVQDKHRDEGGMLKIATSNSVNRKILEITRLDHQLEVFDSVIDAVKSFR